MSVTVTSHKLVYGCSFFCTSLKNIFSLGFPAIKSPDELEEQLEEDTKGSERTLSAENQSSDKKTEASLKALDMLDRGLLTERAVLAVIGTHEESYTVAPNVRIKALELVEQDKLSERGLIAILGV